MGKSTALKALVESHIILLEQQLTALTTGDQLWTKKDLFELLDFEKKGFSKKHRLSIRKSIKKLIDDLLELSDIYQKSLELDQSKTKPIAEIIAAFRARIDSLVIAYSS